MSRVFCEIPDLTSNSSLTWSQFHKKLLRTSFVILSWIPHPVQMFLRKPKSLNRSINQTARIIIIDKIFSEIVLKPYLLTNQWLAIIVMHTEWSWKIYWISRITTSFRLFFVKVYRIVDNFRRSWSFRLTQKINSRFESDRNFSNRIYIEPS